MEVVVFHQWSYGVTRCVFSTVAHVWNIDHNFQCKKIYIKKKSLKVTFKIFNKFFFLDPFKKT